jgi:glycerophosphoryl diester phosphodiesterase
MAAHHEQPSGKGFAAKRLPAVHCGCKGFFTLRSHCPRGGAPADGQPVTAVLAHRGRTGEGGPAENTIEAFLAARRLGVDGVELDVRLSADGALVVHHDPLVAGGRALAETALRDLPTSVPLLIDVLEACEGLLVNVEIKNAPGEPGYDPGGALALQVAGELGDGGWTDQVVVSSFSQPTVDAVRSADPRLAVGWLLAPGTDAAGAIPTALERGYQAVHPFVSDVTTPVVEAARQAGLAITVWTVNADEDLRAMVALGVDALITDRPAVALAVALEGA